MENVRLEMAFPLRSQVGIDGQRDLTTVLAQESVAGRPHCLQALNRTVKNELTGPLNTVFSKHALFSL